MNNNLCICLKFNILIFITYDRLIDQAKILENLEETKLYLASIDYLVINGNMLMSKWNIRGQQIKLAKDFMLDSIFKDNCVNTVESLELVIDAFVFNV